MFSDQQINTINTFLKPAVSVGVLEAETAKAVIQALRLKNREVGLRRTVSVKQAMEILSFSKSQIFALVKSGELKGRHTGSGSLRLDLVEVYAYAGYTEPEIEQILAGRIVLGKN